MWALGCILYELVFKAKAFPRDFHVFEYIHNKRVPPIHALPGNECLRSHIRELICRMLEVKWWKRPSARDVLAALESVSNQSSPASVCLALPVESRGSPHVFHHDNNPASQLSAGFTSNDVNESLESEGSERLLLGSLARMVFDDEDEGWAKTQWKVCW